jgi:hypothetical protein
MWIHLAPLQRAPTTPNLPKELILRRFLILSQEPIIESGTFYYESGALYEGEFTMAFDSGTFYIPPPEAVSPDAAATTGKGKDAKVRPKLGKQSRCWGGENIQDIGTLSSMTAAFWAQSTSVAGGRICPSLW